MKNIVLSRLFLFFVFPTIISAQITSDQIDETVVLAMNRMEVAGVSVAVVKDGKVVHSKGYGFKSVNSKEKVDEHTNFAIASNSKAFTTAALAMLVEEGKLQWTDKVVSIIPEFTMYNDYVTQNFNIQDLLTHRSGLGLGAGDLMFFPDGTDFTIEDILKSFQYFEPQSAFRTKFDYDNLLYYVAGEVVKRKSGKSWEDFIETRIFKPLGMNHSYSFGNRIEDKINLSSAHNANSGELLEIESIEKQINGAAGGIYSNVHDLSKWMLLHLNEGKYGEKPEEKLFYKESQEEMWKIHTVLDVYNEPRYNSHFNGYGLGWFLTDIKGNLVASHTGGLPGMLSKTLLVPDIDLGIVVLTNTEPGGGFLFEAITKTILDSYLGLEEKDWVSENAGFLEKMRSNEDRVTQEVWATVAKADSKDIDPKNFMGIYEDKWFGKVEVFLKNNELWFKSFRSPKLNGKMEYYKDNTFAIRWEYQAMNADALAMFTLDEKGKAKCIKMSGISPNIDFSFDFQDLNLIRIN